MYVVLIALCTFAAIFFFHIGVLIAGTNWTWKNVSLIYTDYPRYEQRKANPPWYERYNDWVDDRLTRAARAIRRAVKR